MASEPSIWREIGMPSEYVTRQPKRRRAADRRVGEGFALDRAPKTRHRFMLAAGRAETAACRFCRQPKFAVDGLPCRGRA